MSWTHNLTSYSIQIVTHAPNMIWQVDFKIIPQKKLKKRSKLILHISAYNCKNATHFPHHVKCI